MKVRILPSVFGDDQSRHQYLTTFLVNNSIAIDAGSLGFFANLDDQRNVQHLFISHSHIDHIASLPIFLENVYNTGDDCVTIHASDEVIHSLKKHVFNDVVWPDFIRLSREMDPFLKFESLSDQQTVEIDGVRITPVSVHHLVPTYGFILDDTKSAIMIATDTGPTQTIWEMAQRIPHLKAVFLDASFPDCLSQIALLSQHLTPTSFTEEIKKLQRQTRIVAVHIKVRFHDQVVEELERQKIPGLEIGVPGKVYQL